MSANPAVFQKFWNKYIYNPHVDTEERGNFLDKNLPLNGSNVDDLFDVNENESGESVTLNTSLTVSAVYRAVKILSDTMGSVQVQLVQPNEDGGVEVLKDHEAHQAINYPTDLMSSFDFRSAMQACSSLQGNSLARIEETNSGVELWPIEKKVSLRYKNNNIRYKVEGSSKLLSPDEVIHLKPFTLNGIEGLSFLDMAAESIGLALGQQKSNARFNRNNAQPSGALVYERSLSAEQVENIKEAWKSSHGGKNKFGTAILSHGAKFTPTMITPEQAQFLQSREFSITEIARWFGIPPHLLYDLRRATFSNIEHQQIEFVVYTIRGLAKMWEEELDRKLLTKDEREDGIKFKFNLNSLMRGDAKSRAEYYQTLANVGGITPNKIAEFENLPRVEGGDNAFIPMNVTTVARAANGDGS